ncbi:PhzF family phenazine biosynthesis protein [Microbacterium betulae]|uniref:PhzF family phenazine biosynthesis protein n=1 Tax=Microbacterium betulae TaxID=2981139 RepID=A0AA97FJG9_9MICO|nr:PhzF family phenazine biosynthesis protein [Microbacterium sp. AB]WOF24621.1 PhzF family phenazine biosynthesis protein [Microbacterium sp. AB]
MHRPFRQIDVFGEEAFTGNPVAVIGSAEGLSTEEMRAVSRWTNLSECTFLLPPTRPGADYRVRIFSLDAELPFAGHPTLGTARTWIDLGGRPARDGEVVQECGAGLVPVRFDDDRYAFRAPPLVRSGPVDERTARDALALIGVDHAVDMAWVDNGPGWLGILLEDADDVLRIVPDIARRTATGLASIGVVGPYPEGSEAAFELRAFFTDEEGADLREDPVTGSLNASVAQWLTGTGRARTPYLARQGTRLGRRGRITVEGDGDDLWIGGRTDVCVSGTIDA